MRIGVFILALSSLAGCWACGHTNARTKAITTASASDSASTIPTANSSASTTANSGTKPATDASTSEKVDFQTHIRPVLQARCQPCHFSGGQVYQRMPFDRPETIRTLGTKLFTRIKEDNERRLIRDFLAQ